jgi:hypothetical protein
VSHPLIRQLRFTRSEFRRAIRTVSAEEAVARLHGLNSITWSIGHMAWQEQKYFLRWGQGRMPFPEIDPIYRSGAPSSTPPLDEVLPIWNSIHRETDPWLDTLTETSLRQPYVRPNGMPGGRIVGSLVQRVIYHYWYHLGQNMAIRRMLGHARLPQFVGNIDEQAPFIA